MKSAFPNAAVKYITKINDLKDLETGEGARVIYFKGNLDLKGNDNLTLKTNNGGQLIIIEGYVDIGGNSKLDINGIVYATKNIKIAGGPSTITGGLWSENNIEFKGTSGGSLSYNPLDVSLGPQEATFLIKMVR